MQKDVLATEPIAPIKAIQPKEARIHVKINATNPGDREQAYQYNIGIFYPYGEVEGEVEPGEVESEKPKDEKPKDTDPKARPKPESNIFELGKITYTTSSGVWDPKPAGDIAAMLDAVSAEVRSLLSNGTYQVSFVVEYGNDRQPDALAEVAKKMGLYHYIGRIPEGANRANAYEVGDYVTALTVLADADPLLKKAMLECRQPKSPEFKQVIGSCKAADEAAQQELLWPGGMAA